MLTSLEKRGYGCFNVLLNSFFYFFVCRKDQSSVTMQLPHCVTFVYGSKLRMFLMMLTLLTMTLLFLSLGTVLEITFPPQWFTFLSCVITAISCYLLYRYMEAFSKNLSCKRYCWMKTLFLQNKMQMDSLGN